MSSSDHSTDTTWPPASLRWLERALWIAAAILLGWVLYTLADGEIFQLRAESRLEHALAARSRPTTHLQELPGDDGEGEAPEPMTVPTAGAPIGRLEIPRLGVSVMVAEGTSSRVLSRAVGHLAGTALPGSGGNVALAGHRDRYFRPLKDIQDGDEILLTTPQGTFRYQVEWTKIVDPTDVEVIDPTARPALTLVTCYPFYYVGHAPHRFAVRARRIGWQPAGIQPASEAVKTAS